MRVNSASFGSNSKSSHEPRYGMMRALYSSLPDVRLAAVVVEEHARRTVQLRDDDALGAVDDEGAVLGHERDLAHVDLLLLHVLDRLVRRLAVVDHQAHGHAQRRAVAQAAVAALALVERRVAELVADVFQRGIAVVADDREHRLQRGVQATVLALGRVDVLLQEFAVGIDLDREQERHVQDRAALAEVLADALLLGERIRSSTSNHAGARGLESWQLRSSEHASAFWCEPHRAAVTGNELPVGSRWYCRHQHAFSRYFQLSTRYVCALSATVSLRTAKGRGLSPPASVHRHAAGDARTAYLTSTVAPAASRSFFIFAASSFDTASFTTPSGFDQVLGFLQAQAGDGADGLDDFDLLLAGRLQDDVELGLLFDRSGGGGRAGGHAPGQRRRRRTSLRWP